MNEELIFRSIRGETTTEEEQRIAAWRSASAENEAQYRLLGRALGALHDLRVERSTLPPPSRQRLVRLTQERSRMRKAAASLRRPQWVRRTVAAAVLIVLGFGVSQWRGSRPPHADSGVDQFVTGPAEIFTVNLRDGTVVRLAPQSRLRLEGQGGQRLVTLEGRGYFAVAKRDQPFRVRTSAGDVQVLGTRFEVRAEESGMRLVVVEGRVAVAAAGRRLELGAGDVTQVVAGRAPRIARVRDPYTLIDWVGNFLVFESTPLDQVAREISDRYGLPVILEDSQLAKREVTGEFTGQTLTEVVSAVCRVVAIECSIGDRMVRLGEGESLGR